ncbi:MAG TPA: hypothetical protein DEP91_08030 [Sphingomonas bacterium]|jgi:hypothetical protein|uniref:2OG-Fe(II) oxygenase n=1 Tax=Sphingomonas bacterium TaxID=1895847 RepID=A0A3D0WBW6_9SPHN|nr:hypothetical protein [Sphingomonas bacterium]
MNEVAACLDRGLALRGEERMGEADAAFTRAHALAPRDPVAARCLAQIRFERGYPAAALFAAARALAPGDRDLLRNEALALAAERAPDQGEALLADAVAAAPDWLDGQRVLATLRWTHELGDPFAGYAAGVEAMPGNAALWLAWFAAVAQQRDWPAARTILDQACAAIGETRGLLLAETFMAVERDADRGEARRLLDLTTGIDDAGLSICRIRFALREEDWVGARDTAQAMLGGPAAMLAWPYLALAWHLLGDPAAEWLEGDPRLVGEYPVALSDAEIGELTETLRSLHTARAPYGEQSVRGGTQTDRSVLLRHEPILARTRAALMAAVEAHVAQLPPPDPRHPLLGRPRAPLRLAGSWSVRLSGGGRNVPHTHPAGWLSSAFYVTLPDGEGGALALGTPPPELGLDLPPRRVVRPVVGRVVLFPSTLWHSTLPFTSGERLNIAFDIVPAARRGG